MYTRSAEELDIYHSSEMCQVIGFQGMKSQLIKWYKQSKRWHTD